MEQKEQSDKLKESKEKNGKEAGKQREVQAPNEEQNDKGQPTVPPPFAETNEILSGMNKVDSADVLSDTGIVDGMSALAFGTPNSLFGMTSSALSTTPHSGVNSTAAADCLVPKPLFPISTISEAGCNEDDKCATFTPYSDDDNGSGNDNNGGKYLGLLEGSTTGLEQPSALWGGLGLSSYGAGGVLSSSFNAPDSQLSYLPVMQRFPAMRASDLDAFDITQPADGLPLGTAPPPLTGGIDVRGKVLPFQGGAPEMSLTAPLQTAESTPPSALSPSFTPKSAGATRPASPSDGEQSSATPSSGGAAVPHKAPPSPTISAAVSAPAFEPSASRKVKRQICRYYMQGNCRRGENCSYSHDLRGVSVTGAAEGATVTTRRNGSGSDGNPGRSQQAGHVQAEKQPSAAATPTPASASASTSGQRKQSHRQTISEEAASNDPEALRGHIYDMCKDQQGCRSLQKLLDENSPRITSMVFDEVLDHIVKLMSDPFGNYLCQKLLEYCTPAQRLQIVKKASGDLVSISVNMHGTRAAQKLIDLLQNEEEISIVRAALADHVVQLIQDLNGNHVIQRCLNKLPPSSTQFIYDAVTREGNAIAVATHRHGCCVLQRCIDSASDEQKMQLVNEVIRNALPLVKDPFGNYVVQYVLDLPFPGIAARLVRTLRGHIAELSMQKFSSNVMEKIVQKSDDATRDSIIGEIIGCGEFGTLISDPYANYVIQTCLHFSSMPFLPPSSSLPFPSLPFPFLSFPFPPLPLALMHLAPHTDPQQHNALLSQIQPHQNLLRNTPYGKKILNIIQRESR